VDKIRQPHSQSSQHFPLHVTNRNEFAIRAKKLYLQFKSALRIQIRADGSFSDLDTDIFENVSRCGSLALKFVRFLKCSHVHNYVL
jgi:hypothetical protein